MNVKKKEEEIEKKRIERERKPKIWNNINRNCLFCHKAFSRYTSINKEIKYCSQECYKRDVLKKSKKPSKEDLKEDLKCGNFCLIGKKYKVSGNSVKKWAKSYALI